MANVHRIGDYRSEERAPLMGQRGGGGYNIMFGGAGSGEDSVDPRKETPFQMCKFNCCPALTWNSFIAIVTVLEVGIYIATCCFGFQKGDFIAPTFETLDKWGARKPCEIKNDYKLWLLVTPIFLHANFLHILFNAASQLIIGSQVETIIGTKKTIFLYLISGIAGNLFGGLVSPTAFGVGASTSIFGLLGIFIAFLIVNWNRLDPMVKCMMFCVLFFMFLLNFSFTMGASRKENNRVDQAGHAGGFLAGVFAGMFLIIPIGGAPGQYEKKVNMIGIITTVCYFVLMFALFFTVLGC